jgi:multimeric flavodoxin WrbA
MNVVAVNGSPRKDWNTAILLSGLEGAASAGAQTRMVRVVGNQERTQ